MQSLHFCKNFFSFGLTIDPLSLGGEVLPYVFKFEKRHLVPSLSRLLFWTTNYFRFSWKGGEHVHTIMKSGDLHRGRKGLRIIGVIAGGLLAAVGLELFLMPHKLVPGGIAGLSALFAHVTEMRLGLFLFLFNLPFILISRRQIHLRFALYVMLGLFCLTAGSLALHHFPALTGEPLTASIAGGLSLGFGIGISIRFGGMSGGAGDMGYAFLSKGPSKSAEIVVMVFNCAILLFGGVLFGWDQAMYSIIAYLLAFEAVRISLRDLSRTRAVWITSSRPEDIRRVLRHKLERETRLVRAAGPDGQPATLFCIASKLEEEELTLLVHSCDRDSQIVFRSARSGRLAALFRD